MCDTIKETTNASVAPTYQEYSIFLMSTAEKLEDTAIDNSVSQKVNVAKLYFLHLYSPTNDHYDEATNLSLYIGAQE